MYLGNVRDLLFKAWICCEQFSRTLTMATRTQILVRGIVQGVGFRPYILSLARKRDLRGTVLNNETGVLIDVEGEEDQIERFIADLPMNPPPLSNVESLTRTDNLPIRSFRDFQILPSVASGPKFIPISADISTCEDCLAELIDEDDRRYRYPFINCTNCGPRFTIIDDVPYDRASRRQSDCQGLSATTDRLL